MDPLPVHVTHFVESTTLNKFDPERSWCYNPSDITVLVDPDSEIETLETRCVIEDGCIIRADLGPISMGQFCILEQNVIIRPPRNVFTDYVQHGPYLPQEIGSHVIIGEGSIIEAIRIGSHVHIGRDVVIGERCMLGDCCQIDDGAVVPMDSVLAPYMRYSGNPARVVHELPESTKEIMADKTVQYYSSFSLST